MPTPSTPLTSILSLPNLSFNLMSVSKLTRALKCYISFFPLSLSRSYDEADY